MNEISNATLRLGTIDKELAHAVAVQTLLHGARHAMDLIIADKIRTIAKDPKASVLKDILSRQVQLPSKELITNPY